MAIVGQVVVESRRYSGWTDPRYPIGYWQASLTLVGDASGGLFSIDLLFQPAFPAFLNSQMYSVERFGISSNEDADRVVRLAAINMNGPANQPAGHAYAISLLTSSSVASGGATGSALNLVPWFLGSQRQAGTSASLSLITLNSDLISFTLDAEGYRWSPRSVLVDGGPQRPPTGLYQR